MATCNTATLFASAKCFTCLTPREFWPLKLALLCQIAQGLNPAVDCSVNGLLANGKCFTCLSTREYWILKLQLLCNILSGSGGGGGGVIPSQPTNLDISNSSNNGATILTWSQASAPTNNSIERSINGAGFVEIASISGSLTTFNDSQILNNGDLYRYRVRGMNGTNFGAYSNTAAVGNNITYNATPDVTISIPDLIQMYGNFIVTNEASLTTLSLPLLRNVGGTLATHTNTVLNSVNWTSLRQVGGTLQMSDSLVTSITLNNLIGVTGAVDFDTSGLTSLTLPKLLTVGSDFSFISTPSMGAVSCALLNQISGSLKFNSSALTSFSMPFLTTVNGALIGSSTTALTNLTIGFLSSVGGDLNVASSTALTTISFANLLTIGGNLAFSGCTLLTSVTLTSLQSASGVTSQNCAAITTLSFPALTTLNITQWLGKNCGSLASLSIPVLVFDNGVLTFDFSLCALNAASVNQVLARGVASNTTNDKYFLQGGTNAAPSGQGITDKATLITRGNTVNTN